MEAIASAKYLRGSAQKARLVVDMIRGKRGTEVRLTIIPATSIDGSLKKEVRLIRDEIKLTEQRRVYIDNDGDKNIVKGSMHETCFEELYGSGTH